MDTTTETNENTYEITFRFKTMKEMNKFMLDYDRWKDEEALDEQRREQRSKDRHNSILRYKKRHPELSMSQCASKIRDWEV